MARLTNIRYAPFFKNIETTDADITGVKPAVLRHMLFLIHLIREFEVRLLELKDENQVHGPVHSSIGQEGCAVGALQLLSREDRITSTHRGHHHFLAKAYNAYGGSEFDPRDGIPGVIEEVTLRTLAEILGLAQGYCRGRGGSMHLGDSSSGCIGTNAIVAGGVPCAAGVAWAEKLKGTGRVSVAFLGDGAVNQGSVHEAMNMAALYRLPALFFIENNLYAVATHVEAASSVADLGRRGLGYGIPALVVDGMDPVAVLKAMETALKHLRSEGPFIIEAKTYRFKHQAQGLPGSAFGYRSKEEEAAWQARDARVCFARKLRDLKVVTEAENDEYIRSAAGIVSQAVDSLTTSPEADAQGKSAPRVRLDLFPGPEDLMLGIRSAGAEFGGIRFSEQADFADLRERTYIDVIPEVLKRRLDRDPGAVILGEEVANMKGGAFLATKGIHKAHPGRVISTPISECGFTGMALGLALAGMRPIVEIMYPDFTLVAADQIFNQIAKFRYMYGNQYDIPIVFRTRVGIGSGYGAQHSMEPAALYALFPGWRIVAPSNPFDYIGLLNSAFLSNDPVLVIEHAALYSVKGPVPADRDYCIALGRANVLRKGEDVTLVAYSNMVPKALEAAAVLQDRGTSAEVVDLRSVDYAGIDYETLGASLQKTGRICILEEGLVCGGVGAQIAYEIQNRFFDYLDCEIGRVAGKPLVMPVSRIPEENAVPQAADIVAVVEKMVPPG